MFQLKLYLQSNVERLNEQEKKKLKKDFLDYFVAKTSSGNGTVLDELYDFFVYANKNMTPRFERFGKTSIDNYPITEFSKVLDVGAGRMCRLSKYLFDRGYVVTAMDPNIRLNDGEIPEIKL